MENFSTNQLKSIENNVKSIKTLIEKSIDNGFTVSVHNYFMPTVYNEPVNIMVDMSNDIDEVVDALDPTYFGRVRLIEVFNGDKEVMTLEADLVEYDKVSGRGFTMTVDPQEPAFK